MLKLLFRLIALIALAIAVVMAVLDATRSIAENAITLTPLSKSWASFAPSALENFTRWCLANLPHFVWDLLIKNILQLPGFVVFAALAFMIAMSTGSKSSTPNIGTVH